MRAIYRTAPALATLSVVLVLAASRPACAAAIARGGTFPIHLHPAALAEAEKPGVEVNASFVDPGPERFYGWALRDLRDYLQQMTGARHPFMRLEANARSGIFAGTFGQVEGFKPRQEASRQALASPDPEAFVVEVQGDRLFILGRSHHGLMAATYGFLDRLGCKWLAPGKAWENVPEVNGLSLDARLNVASAGPSYRWRWFFVSFGPDFSVFRKEDRAKYGEWLRRNRQGGSAYTANYHNDPAMVPPALFEKQPELFALVQGKRNPYGLSRANPETVALAVESAVKYLRENETKGSFYHSFSVETNDGSPACEWSLKRMAEAKLGRPAPTDLNYWFANQVAAGIEKAGLKDRWVGMCSYSDHSMLPSFDIHPRVAVQVTTGLAFSDTWDEAKGQVVLGPIDLTVEQRLEGLRKRGCRRIGIYDYPDMVTWTRELPGCGLAMKPREFAASLKRYHAHGATSFIGETSDSWVNAGAGRYVGTRLLWDADSDPEKELAAYHKDAFGPAAPEIRALHADWENYVVAPGALPRIARERCARWHDLIAAADGKVWGRPVYQARLTAAKRYYLYLNLTREFEIDLLDPKLPSKTERLARLLRYVASNRGEGAFHGYGLYYTLLEGAKAPPGFRGVVVDQLGADLVRVSKNYTDEESWRAFPPISDEQIGRVFAAAKLPAEARGAGGTLDPALKVFPADAQPPAQLRFPRLHGPPGVLRRYILKVVAPTPRLTFRIVAGTALGGGEDRTCIVTDPRGQDIKRFAFKIGEEASFELADLQPGVYVATFPERGLEQLTVVGDNTFGAVQGLHDDWGFNPMRRSDQKETDEVRAYFRVPAGAAALTAGLSDGTVSLGLRDGGVLAADVKGSPQLKAKPDEIGFAPSDRPRVGYVRLGDGQMVSSGFVIEGVTLYSPDPSYVLYETMSP